MAVGAGAGAEIGRVLPEQGEVGGIYLKIEAMSLITCQFVLNPAGTEAPTSAPYCEVIISSGSSLRSTLILDVGRPDHLAPLLGLVGDEPPKFGGRARKRHPAQISKSCLHPGIGCWTRRPSPLQV
jgi:hypothetical protein